LYLFGLAETGFPCWRVYHDLDVLPVLRLVSWGFSGACRLPLDRL